MTTSLPKIIALIGPTASGKTKLSLELARTYDGEIISLDSRAIYRGLDIGSAKPRPKEQAFIRHHLIDIADPDQTITLSEFKEKTLQTIGDIIQRGKTPFLVGGTALYLYAIIENWHIPNVTPDKNLRDRLEQKPISDLWAELLEKDPAVIDFIDPHNKRRIIRALEVIEATGEPFSKQRQPGPKIFETLVLGLNPDEVTLRRTIEQRTQAMLDQGLIEEVQRLLTQGYEPSLPALSGIHYKEVIDYLNGTMTKDEMIQLINTHDWQLTRRQMTWFKRDPRIQWLNTPEQTTELITAFLK